MKAPLCVQTLENAVKANPDIRGSIIHSDRGSQYASRIFRNAICKYGIKQSMNSAGGGCHGNAHCESMWAEMKSELLYDRYDTSKKVLVGRMTRSRQGKFCGRPLPLGLMRDPEEKDTLSLTRTLCRLSVKSMTLP